VDPTLEGGGFLFSFYVIIMSVETRKQGTQNIYCVRDVEILGFFIFIIYLFYLFLKNQGL